MALRQALMLLSDTDADKTLCKIVQVTGSVIYATQITDNYGTVLWGFKSGSALEVCPC